MKTRIITSVVAVGLFIPFCVFSSSPFWVFLIFAGLVSLFAVYEILKCTSLHKNLVASLLSYTAALAAPLLTRLAFKGTERYYLIMSFIYFALLFLSFVNATFSKGKIPVVNSCVATVMTIYVSFSMASIVLLRDLGPDGAIGATIYLRAFIFAWVPDIGGYFFGRFFGKRKLIPDVSPKKTVAGFVGGIGSAVVVSIVYGFIIGLRFKDLTAFAILAVLAVICAVVSVCGDLLASLVKRYFGIKDYGFIFPGHGGVMDRFDSVIAVAPFLYILCYLADSFGWLSSFVTL